MFSTRELEEVGKQTAENGDTWKERKSLPPVELNQLVLVLLAVSDLVRCAWEKNLKRRDISLQQKEEKKKGPAASLSRQQLSQPRRGAELPQGKKENSRKEGGGKGGCRIRSFTRDEPFSKGIPNIGLKIGGDVGAVQSRNAYLVGKKTKGSGILREEKETGKDRYSEPTRMGVVAGGGSGK